MFAALKLDESNCKLGIEIFLMLCKMSMALMRLLFSPLSK